MVCQSRPEVEPTRDFSSFLADGARTFNTACSPRSDDTKIQPILWRRKCLPLREEIGSGLSVLREVASKRRNCSREDTRRDSQEGERGAAGLRTPSHSYRSIPSQ